MKKIIKRSVAEIACCDRRVTSLAGCGHLAMEGVELVSRVLVVAGMSALLPNLKGGSLTKPFLTRKLVMMQLHQAQAVKSVRQNSSIAEATTSTNHLPWFFSRQWPQ